MSRRRALGLAVFLLVVVLYGWFGWMQTSSLEQKVALDDAIGGKFVESPRPTAQVDVGEDVHLGVGEAKHSAATSSGTVPTQSRILIVSALFPLTKSKHSDEDYRNWLGQFLGRISTDVYFYAPPPLEELVRKARQSPPPPGHGDDETKSNNEKPKDSKTSNHFYMHLNTTYPTPFSIPPLQGKQPAYTAMHPKDRERHRHSPELYAVWNAKPFFLHAAVRDAQARLGREYDYAFWVDAGSFRDDVHFYRAWPDAGEVARVLEGVEGAVPDPVFIPIQGPPGYRFRSWTEEDGPVDDDVSEGSFFGGSSRAIEWYTKTFYAYHDYYLSKGYFVGKDQTFINALLLLFPRRFTTLVLNDARIRPSKLAFWTKPNPCGAWWYFYEWVLANARERAGMQGKWNAEWVQSRWRSSVKEGWAKVKGAVVGSPAAGEGEGCPVLRAASVERVLQGAFGPRWRHPVPMLLPDPLSPFSDER